MAALWDQSLEGDLCVVVNTSDLDWPVHVDSSLLQLSLLLELGESTRFFELLLPCLTFGLLALGVG